MIPENEKAAVASSGASNVLFAIGDDFEDNDPDNELQAPARWFFHGDKKRDGLFFCGRCDLSFPESHFFENRHHGRHDSILDHLQKLRFHREDWQRRAGDCEELLGGDGKTYFRPKRAENIFDGIRIIRRKRKAGA